jgi:hypothetical protein
MMNIIIKNKEGKTKRVDSYIGIEGEGFSQVAHSANLDQLGVIYSYSSLVQQLKAALPFLIEIFNENINRR